MCPPAGFEGVARPEALQVWLLGGFRVSVGTRTLGEDAWRLKKAASLVKLLALSPRHRLHREQAMDLLWPHLGRRAAANNLRGALHAARRALDPDPDISSGYVVSKDERIALYPGGSVWVDVEAFEEAARTARRERELAAYRAALDLYAGELLPEDRYEQWAEERRRELLRLYLALLVELAGLYEERSDHDSAIETLNRAVAEEPVREEAHVGLMRLYALSGSKAQALRQYESLREITSRELETEPSAMSRALREEIASGRYPPPERPTDTAVEGAPDPTRHNLPAQRTSFVGREREILEVKRELAMTRLLTLTGTGGSGKTRLALEVAHELIGAYPDGVWLTELAELSEAMLVAQEAAETLGIREQTGRSLEATLVEGLRRKEMLLILDNCEHLIDAVARLTEALLDACPKVRILATSREPLRVAGEAVRPVSPLSVPTSKLGIDDLARHEAVRLFVERTRLRVPAFELTPQNAQAAAKTCRMLEGIPLAIELVAARMGTLGVEQTAQRLEGSLALLDAGPRTAAPRQRTMRASLEWSYDLLEEPERKLFRRLSVLAGGWALEAAEAVCSEGGIEEEGVLGALSNLVDKSLVVAETTADGRVRYRMLEPVRQYALEKLAESVETEEVRSQHAEFFLALAEEAEPQMRGPEQAAWLARLATEHDNLRAALSWALEHEEADLGLRLARALWWFWSERGYCGEGRGWLEEALAKAGRASTASRVKALDAVGWLAWILGDMDRVVVAAEAGLELSAEAQVEFGIMASLRSLLAEAASYRGDYEQATRIFEEELALSREAGDRRYIAESLLQVANVANARGEHEQAMQHYEEGMALCSELGDTVLLATFSLNLGYTYLLRGDYERAAALCEEAAELYREQRQKGSLPFALGNLGYVALLSGDHERARTLHEETLVLCQELGHQVIAAESLEGLACAAGARGEAERAAKMFGAAWALHEAVGYNRPPEERALREPYLAAARSRLDEATWEAAFAEGQVMTFEEAVEYALSSKETDPPTGPAPEAPSTGEPMDRLTAREKEVAALVARGLSNREIAQEFHLSERTVYAHLRTILKKLGLRSREQVVSRLTGR